MQHNQLTSKEPHPSPSDANVVTLQNLGNGNVALQCGGGYNAFASVRDDYGYQVQFQAPSSATWCTRIGADEILQAVPTGDGYFALYSPHFGRYVVINPRPDQTAGNCNPLAASATDISQAARFTATGLKRNIVYDFLEVSGNASGLSFAGMSLAKVNLSGYNLSWCDFSDVTSLTGCNLGGAHVQHAKFCGRPVGGLLVAGTDFTAADFTGCDFTGFVSWTVPPPVFAGAVLIKATVPGALPGLNMAGAKLAGAHLRGCDMAGSDLSGADFKGTELLRGADLTGANLSGQLTNLTGAKFNDPTLKQRDATLQHCNLGNANLSGAILAQCDLRTTILAGANLSGAILAGATLGAVDLQRATLAGTDFTGINLSKVTFSFPLNRSTDKDHPTIFEQCTLPYSVIQLNWSCLDLTGATITGLPTNLAGLDATGLRLPKASFAGCVLDGANFVDATLDNADFTQASLRSQVSFAGAVMPGAVFTQAVLDQATFPGAALGGVKGIAAAKFTFAFISNCDFSQANLYGVLFSSATLISGNKLTGATNLQETDFSDAYLPNADFTGANLQGAKFDGAFMVGCKLTGADLTAAQQGAVPASLTSACLQAASMDRTNLAGANLAAADITTAKGTINQQYYGENHKLTDLTEMGYRGGHLPDEKFFTDTTVCPNLKTYKANKQENIAFAQMLVMSNPPSQWKPTNAPPLIGALHDNP